MLDNFPNPGRPDQPQPRAKVTWSAWTLTLGTTLLLSSCLSPIARPHESVVHGDLEAFCSGQSRPVESFELVGDRDWQRGVVVLYAGGCGSEPSAKSPLSVKGYKVFERQGWRWQPIGAGSVTMETDAPEAAQPISYSIGYSPDDNYALVEGQIYSPDVATVEARFDSGIWLQDSGEDDRFAIVASGANSLCELRVLNDQGEVIFRDPVSNACESAATD